MRIESKKKRFFIFIVIIIILIVAWTLFAVIPPQKVIKDNPFLISKGERPLIAAHRGGKNLNPENTMLAFDYAIENYGIDILELDLCMTKDEHLVAIHDFSINSCSDVEEILGSNQDYYVIDFTLEELSQFNFGSKFIDREGHRPYADLAAADDENRADIIREAKLNITTIDEIFSAFYLTDLMFIVEIKNNGIQGEKAADILYSLMTDNQRYPNGNLLQRVVIGTFHDEIQLYIREKYPLIFCGASVGEAARFILTQMFGVNLFSKSNFVCLQIPTSYRLKGINFDLTKKTYINRAHQRNISVQYWTINDKEIMKELIKAGADVIMTDDPDVLYQVMIDLGYNFNK
ncbi:MAG: hypothetical protein M0R05_01080 [Bacilli bacterium]|nr:hypothetical protein [Bacilli bacterium]MDD4076387.1 glycerophosphodiester phosphodiesterase family protein [Bacilli bacterium]MDD4388510.1 glycerophosphodiester phosphodiesterase family protein [Bacilli bacterium]